MFYGICLDFCPVHLPRTGHIATLVIRRTGKYIKSTQPLLCVQRAVNDGQRKKINYAANRGGREGGRDLCVMPSQCCCTGN